MTTVAFQGVSGAYSDEAAQMLFPAAEIAGHPTFAEAFDSLAEGRSDIGVIPVENTVAGIVQEVSDLLWTHESIRVVGEYVAPIRHVLMSNGRGRVRRALSHPQALAQCASWLNSNGIEPVIFYDTAGAAREIARNGADGDGAIASAAAALRYRLTVVSTGIADSDSNQTRFLILSANTIPESILAGDKLTGSSNHAGNNPQVHHHSLTRQKLIVGFTTEHRPGALAEVIAVFARYDANLTRLDSRPVPHQPFRYRFYADAEVVAGRQKELTLDLRAAVRDFREFGSFAVGSFSVPTVS